MKKLDRAATAALSLTGVVVATAIGVAFTAAARSPEAPPAQDGTIALVSPRASSTPEAVQPSPEATAFAASGPTVEPAALATSGSGSSAGRGSGSGGSSNRRPVPPAVADQPAAPRPAATGAATGVTRGDGTPEDVDRDDDSDDDRGGHGGDDDDDDDDDD